MTAKQKPKKKVRRRPYDQVGRFRKSLGLSPEEIEQDRIRVEARDSAYRFLLETLKDENGATLDQKLEACGVLIGNRW